MVKYERKKCTVQNVFNIFIEVFFFKKEAVETIIRKTFNYKNFSQRHTTVMSMSISNQRNYTPDKVKERDIILVRKN